MSKLPNVLRKPDMRPIILFMDIWVHRSVWYARDIDDTHVDGQNVQQYQGHLIPVKLLNTLDSIYILCRPPDSPVSQIEQIKAGQYLMKPSLCGDISKGFHRAIHC